MQAQEQIMWSEEAMEQAFWKFLEENPKAYPIFEKFTLEVINSGRKHYGAKAIAERCRWHSTFEEKGSPWKLNNNLVSYLARMFEELNPQHAGFFSMRKSYADKANLFNVKEYYRKSDPAFFANTTTNKGELIEQCRRAHGK